MTAPQTGTCRCGATRIEVSEPPFMTAACHCTGCQKMSSSAFSLTAMVPAHSLRVVQGDPVKGGLRGPQLDHYFCPECLTWMFTRITGMEDFVNIRPTMFDVPSWCDPFIETMTAEKLPWATTPARHSFEHFPGMADFPALMEAFAAERA
ncbi:GFA family protein [Tropicimonas sp. IMCC34043]|uniref:GFA family protein n=1 Tax=Tropicimonas sp. IMCC34043 TaxID=2248760 RepID=UPI000E244DFF|nr:GFA family protein [Tropicimonas sp. IMCC34043]